MKILTKLLLAFSIMIVVVGIVGGAGLFFASKIQVLSHAATPLVKTSSELVVTMQNAIISFLELTFPFFNICHDNFSCFCV